MWRKTKGLLALQHLVVRIGYPLSAVLMIAAAIPTWELRSSWNILVCYTILSLVVSFLAIKTPNVVITLNNAITFSALLLYGAWASVWCVVIECLIIAFLFRSSLAKVFANAGQILSTVWVVGLTHTWFATTALPPLLADFLLVLLYFAVNTLLCALGIAYFSQQSTWTVAKNLIRHGFFTYVLILTFGGIGARLMESYGVVALLPILVMFLAMRIIFQQYFHILNRLQQKMEEIHCLNETILASLAASIDARDPYTHGHSYRVAYWGRELARAIGLGKKEADDVYYGGILHDIGKIGIEDSILKKEGKLSREEYNRIKQHPIIGYHIVKQAGVFPELLPAIRHHHERYDGSGYPDGLKGEEIPLIARILALSDAFDAMVTDRPYRKGMPVKQALEIIRENAGTQFDAALAETFVQLVRSYSKEQLAEVFAQREPIDMKEAE